MAEAQQPSPNHGIYHFVRGKPVGREDVTVQADASGLTVTSEGRIGAPTNLIFERAEFSYDPTARRSHSSLGTRTV